MGLKKVRKGKKKNATTGVKMIAGGKVCEKKNIVIKESFDAAEIDFGESLEFLFEFGLDGWYVNVC
jgi:hypothetical protein